MKKFTIIVSIYNRISKKEISLFLKSIARSSIQPSEMIVIYDGPIKEEVKNYVEKYKKKSNFKIVIYTFLKNQGASISYNKAVSLSSNEFIMKCDADDFNHRERFKSQLKSLCEGFSLCGGYMLEKYKKNKFLKKVPISYQDLKNYCKYRNPMNHPTVAFQKSIFDNLGGYENVSFKEDYFLWIKWISNYKNICNLNQILVTSIDSERMINRRSGFLNLYTEFLLQKFIVKYKINNLFGSIFVYLSRGITLSLPTKILSSLYKNLLRN